MTTQECKFFGVRGDKLAQTKQCKACAKDNEELYKKCGKATAKEEGTSIIVVKGKTKRVRGPLTAFGKVINDSHKVSAQQEAPPKKTQQKVEKKVSTRLPRVPGIIAYCLELMNKGENEIVIQALLAERYKRAGYPEQKAIARAASIHQGQVREQKKKK